LVPIPVASGPMTSVQNQPPVSAQPVDALQSEAEDAHVLAMELEMMLQVDEELSALELHNLRGAVKRSGEFQKRNTDLEIQIQQLNESMVGFDEKITARENKNQDLAAEYEAHWERKVSWLMEELEKPRLFN